METTLKVNAGKSKDKDGNEIYERSLDFPTPKVILAETIEELVKLLGADYCLHQLKNQMKVSWRAKMRTAMEKKDDNGEYEFSDDAIRNKVYDVNWQPELRITKTAEEKAAEALGALDPEVRKAILAQQLELLKAQKS